MSANANGLTPDEETAKHAPVASDDFTLDLINGRVVFRGRRSLMIREDTMAIPIGYLLLINAQLLQAACCNDAIGAAVRKAMQETPPKRAVAAVMVTVPGGCAPRG